MSKTTSYILKTINFGARHAMPPKGVRGIAIGTFDGVHLGHKLLIKELFRGLEELNPHVQNDAAIISFYPHPRAILSNNQEIKKEYSSLITPLRNRITKFNKLNLSELFFLRFSKKLADFGAEEFVEKILVPLKPKLIVVGEDWCFGRNREGDVSLLKEFGLKYGFEVNAVPLLTSHNVAKLGSSSIRKMIKDGTVELLSDYIGEAFSITGKVIRGDGRGSKIGFPTANVHSVRQLYPKAGVYKTKVIIDGQSLESISNIGIRPTFYNSTNKTHLEAHILNFNQDIYGKEIEVRFISRVRDEKKFSNIDELVMQIKKDIESIANE